MNTINTELIDKINHLLDQGACSGNGTPQPGKMCIEEVICYALGLPHSDNPSSCVGAAPRAFKIAVNDWQGWPDNKARAEALRKLATASLGTAENFDNKLFAEKMALYATNKLVPLAVRAALNMPAFPEAHKEPMKLAAKACEEATDLSAARSAARSAALSAALSAESARSALSAESALSAARSARSAALSAARSALSAESALSAARSAESALSAALSAARSALSAESAARSAAESAESAAESARQAVMQGLIDYAVQVLVDMGTPGSKFL